MFRDYHYSFLRNGKLEMSQRSDICEADPIGAFAKCETCKHKWKVPADRASVFLSEVEEMK